MPTGFLDARRVAVDLVPAGWWRQLVFAPGRLEASRTSPADPSAVSSLANACAGTASAQAGVAAKPELEEYKTDQEKE